MASLEYLTQNSLIAYPFKPRRPTVTAATHPIADNWFCDILFVSFVSTIRSCYISRLEKTIDSRLLITISDATTLTPYTWIDETTEESTDTIVITADNLVNHLDSKPRSFASHKNSLFAVKFVFGPGLIGYPAFSQNYEKAEAELANGTIVMAAPKVTGMTFENYVKQQGNLSPYQPAKSYTQEDIPEVQGRYNVTVPLETDGTAGINVVAGSGFGLFNTCVDAGSIEEIYSINSVTPSEDGKFFIGVDACYALNPLTASEKIVLGESLGKYEPFKLYHSSGDYTDFEFATTANNSLVLTNFCKPKCPPENVQAFAHYLNRVIDGATDLSKAITENKETRGLGTANLQTFTATEFCSEEISPFLRCAEHTSPVDSYIGCNDKFIKYYHEFRKLQIFYNNGEIYSFTILEVIDDNTVLLSSPPPSYIQPKHFRVIDNGVVSDLNCAFQAYNLDAAEFKQPYFKVIHSTSESTDSKGLPITILGIAVAIFNPSGSTINFLVNFDANSKLTQEGKFKIRKESGTYFSETPTATTQCMEYAFIEAIFHMPCGEDGGNVDVSVFKTQNNITTQVGNLFNIPNISAAPCFDSTFTEQKIRITSVGFSQFTYTTQLPANVTSLSDLYYAPEWLSLAFQGGQSILSVSSLYPAPTTNQLFDGVYAAKSEDHSYLYKLVLDYVALPVINSPLTGDFTEADPLLFTPGFAYTATNPLLIISASNMRSVSVNFPEDVYAYSLVNSQLPEGLSLGATTGVITGEVAVGFTQSSPIRLTISATNPAGAALASSVVYLQKYAGTEIPAISFSPAIEEAVFDVDNITSYVSSGGDKVFSITATNPPILSYRLAGDDLPSGLYFNQATGAVTGKLLYFTAQSTSHTIYATNGAGESLGLDFVLNYTRYAAPVMVYPTTMATFELNENSETTAENPLITISAKQLFGNTDNYEAGLTDLTRNKYAFVNSPPPGFVIEQYTGKVYGKITIPVDETKYYSILVSATNPVGTAYANLYIVFAVFGLPVVTPIGAVTVVRGNEYTEQSPLFSISATNQPTSFSATGLPTGLSCTTSGKIIGTVGKQIQAGAYAVSCTATNEYGTSLSETASVILNISITFPESSASYTLVKNQNYSNIFTATHSGVKSGDAVTLTLSGIPTGLSFSNSKLSGTPTVDYLGTMRLLASTISYGYDYIDIPTEVAGVLYSVSGVVLDGLTDLPLSGVEVSANTAKKITTNQYGEYTLLLSNGGYNITPSKTDYVFSPPSIYTQVTSAAITGQIFKGLTQYRGISGYVTKADSTPVADVVISDGVGSATTSSTGFYQLISPLSELTITASSPGNRFFPASIVVAAGTADQENVNFTAVLAKIITGWIADNSGNSYLQEEVVVSAINTETSETYTATIAKNTFSPALYMIAVYDGPYTISASSSGYTFAPTQITRTISSDSTSNNFSAIVAAPISGQVVLASSTYGAAIPVRNATMATIVGGTTYSTTTNSSGLFSFSVPVGTSYLTTKINTTDVALAVQVVSPSTVSIDPYTTQISGTVEYDSAAYTGAALTLTFSDSSQVLRQATSSSSGYRLFSVPAGQYTLTPAEKGFDFTPSSISLTIAGTALVTSKNFSMTANGVTPLAPEIIGYIAQLTGVTIEFTPPTDTPDTGQVLGYKYSTDGGLTYATASSGQFVTPTKIQISSLTEATDYTVKIKAYNLSGDGLSSDSFLVRTAEAPSAPRNLQASLDGSKTVLTFDPPSNNGNSTIINYEYRKSFIEEQLEYNPWISTGAASSPIELNLTGGFTYYIQLRAVTAFASGAASAVVSATPNTVPDQPTILQVTQLNQALYASFNTQLDGGLPITAYQYSFDGGETITTLAIGELLFGISSYFYTFLNLTNGQSYTLKLRAVNSLGYGLWTTALDLIPATAPKPPEILSVQQYNQRLLVDFKILGNTPAEDPDNGGSPVLDYTVQAFEDEGFTQLAKSVTVTESPANVTDLQNGVGYYIRVEARSVVNSESVYGTFASTETYTPTTTAPLNAPIINVAIAGPSEHYKVFFSLPENFDNGGQTANQVAVRIYSDLGLMGLIEVIQENLTYTSIPDTSFFVVEFDRLTQYDWVPSVEVSMQNSVGYGPWSVAASFVDEATVVPAAPEVQLISYTDDLQANETEIAFSVTPGELGNYPLVNVAVAMISNYPLVISQTYTDFDGFSTTLRVPILSVGYSVQITARIFNIIGGSTEGWTSFYYHTVPAIPTTQYLSIFALTRQNSNLDQGIGLSFAFDEYDLDNARLTQIKASVYNVEGTVLEAESYSPLADTRFNPHIIVSYDPIVPCALKKVVITLTNERGSTDVVFNDFFLPGKPLAPVLEYNKYGLGQLALGYNRAPGDLAPSVSTGPQQYGDNNPGYITDKDGNVLYSNLAFGGTYAFLPGQEINIYAWWFYEFYQSDTTTLSLQMLDYPTFVIGTTMSISVRRWGFKINVSNLPNCGGCDCTYSIYAYVSTNSKIADLSETTPTWEGQGPYDPVPDYSLINITDFNYAYIYLPPGPSTIYQVKFILDVANCVHNPPSQTAYADNRRLLSIANFTSSSVTNLIPLAPTITSGTALAGGGGATLSVDALNTYERNIPIFRFQYARNGSSTWVNVPTGDVSSGSGPGRYTINVRNFTPWISQSVRVRILNNQLASGDPSGSYSFECVGVPGTPVIAPQSTVYSDKLPVNFTIATRGYYDITKYSYTTNAQDATPTWVDAVPPNAQVVGNKNTATSLNILKQSNQNSLILGLNYNVKIRASNYLGDSFPSNTVVYVASFVPLKITQITHIPASALLTVNITFAGSGGAPITKYYWSLNGNASSPTWVQVPTTSQTSVTLTINSWLGQALTNGTQYFFKVYAENIAGSGQISDTFVMTPSRTPNAPVINSLVSLDRKIRVMYTAPSFDGGNAIKNYSYSIDDGVFFAPLSPANGSPAYIDIPNLINGEYYIVKIRAINDRGAGAISNYKIGAPKAQ